MNIKLIIKGECYECVSKSPDRYGIIRLDVRKEGSEEKPYSISYHPEKYQDSVVKGWGCSCKGWIIKRGEVRKCKHVVAIAEAMPKQAA
jgi:hypothetical protein